MKRSFKLNRFCCQVTESGLLENQTRFNTSGELINVQIFYEDSKTSLQTENSELAIS